MSDNIEYTQEELEKSIATVLGISQEKASEYIGDIIKAEDDNGDDEDEMGEDGGEKDVEKAYSKIKGEYEEMEKSMSAKKKALDEMEAKMKVKKGEDNELGKDKSEDVIKALTANIEKSLSEKFEKALGEKLSEATEKIEKAESENDELKKSLGDMTEKLEEIQEKFEKAMSVPNGKRGIVTQAQIIEKAESEEQNFEGKNVIHVGNKAELKKAINGLLETATSPEVIARYESDIMNLENGAVTAHKETIEDLMKSENNVFIK